MSVPSRTINALHRKTLFARGNYVAKLSIGGNILFTKDTKNMGQFLFWWNAHPLCRFCYRRCDYYTFVCFCWWIVNSVFQFYTRCITCSFKWRANRLKFPNYSFGPRAVRFWNQWPRWFHYRSAWDMRFVIFTRISGMHRRRWIHEFYP
jgi:hypothetical protein